MKKIFTILVATLVLALSVMPAFAVVSPTASEEYSVTIHNTKGGTGSYTTVTDTDGTHVTLVADAKDGYVFKYWVIDGEYVLVDGDLESDELEILISSDIEATPYYEKEDTESGTDSTTDSDTTVSGSTVSVSQNEDSVSPKTGVDSMYFAIIGIGVFVIIAGAVGVKLVRSNTQ